MSYLLESKELYKTYEMSKNNQQQVLKNINLQIKKGEFISVMGASGSGKSTLLYNISGLDKMTTGTVLFDGEDISAYSEKKLAKLRLHKMGFVFQHIHLLKNLCILDNIILSAYLSKNSSQENINKKAIELMKRTGIANLADHDITQASGGQLQRVAICRALINNPDIIFGDEPTGALNSKSAVEIIDILADINQSGTTILLVTHDVKVAVRTERVLYMMDGNIIGELQLGKYRKENNDSKDREELLAMWLKKMDF